MRKIAIFTILCILTAGAAYGETEPQPTEEDYKNLEGLRMKLMRMRREMDRFMKDVISTYPAEEYPAVSDFGQDVKVDITENDKDITVRADMPGMDKDKIDITLEGGSVLKIAGTREVVKSQTAPGVVRQERMSGKFERVLKLPAECKSEGIKASYNNGVLEIAIPKKKDKKEEAVKISIQ